MLSYPNMSSGKGLEMIVNWANTSMNNLPIPIFLFVFYGLAIYLMSKTEWKLGGSITFCSFLFFLLAMIAQTFAYLNQIIIFIFIIGIAVGIVVGRIENAR
jgi:ABC-type proline/glycine betaine transport system permease subunit